VLVDARVEDSGTYSCSVPVLDETKRVTFSVVGESSLTSSCFVLCLYAYTYE